jgi:hypothetical protein
MPNYFRARVIDVRGTTFNSLGYTTKRPGDNQKHLELLPEEALYMVERGSMLCWKHVECNLEAISNQEGDPIKTVGEPMSVQHAFSEMLGVENVMLEHYQVGIAISISANRFANWIYRCIPISNASDIWSDAHNPYPYRKITGYTDTRYRCPHLQVSSKRS